MSNSKKAKPPVDRAVATIKTSTHSDALKVSVTNQITQAMPQSPNWGAAADVQAAVKVWAGQATALATNATLIANLKAQLGAAEAKQLTLRRDWTAAKSHVTTAVTVFAAGSADVVASFSFDVVSVARIGALAAPLGVVVEPGTANGEAVVSWTRGNAWHGFLVQHAADPTNAATVSASIACTRIKLTLGGLPQGGNVSVHVAAIDPASPTGQSPWSTWAVGSAR
jgi:hypothetical protein